MMIPIGSKTLGLAAGSVLAVGFASWNIYQAISGGQVLASGGRRSSSSAPPPQPAQPVVAPRSSSVPVPPTSAPGAPAAAAPSRRAPMAEIAPEADPFVELTMPGQADSANGVPPKPTGVVPTAATAPHPVIPVQVRPKTNAPRFERKPGPERPPILPGAFPRTQPIPATIAAPPRAPELVGTMLGESPCAVFSLGEKVIVARAGDVIGGWKVLEISHSRVRLKLQLGKSELTLRVGEDTSGAVESPSSAQTPSSDAETDPDSNRLPARP